MVGDFEHIDDSSRPEDAPRAEVRVHPDCLKPKDGKEPSLSLATWGRIAERSPSRAGHQRGEKGPMGHALSPPTRYAPRAYYSNKGIDKFIEYMNSDNPYSLLKCPGRYTVQVATFHGQVTINQVKIRELQRSRSVDSGA